MFKSLLHRNVVFGVAGLFVVVHLAGFGVNQQGSKNQHSDRKTNTLEITASRTLVKLPPPRPDLLLPNCELTESEVKLSATFTSPQKTEMNFTWQVPVGRLIGNGRKVTWDLSRVREGTYTVTVEASDKHKHTISSSLPVTVVICPGWLPDPPPCPTVSIVCRSKADAKGPLTFEANVQGGDVDLVPTYQWSVSAGKISAGQATKKITVDATGVSDEFVTATVLLGGVDPLCPATASCTIELVKTKSP